MVESEGSPSVEHSAVIAAGKAGVPGGTVNVLLHEPAAVTGACASTGSVVEETDT
jgi:hypothetical protein